MSGRPAIAWRRAGTVAVSPRDDAEVSLMNRGTTNRSRSIRRVAGVMLVVGLASGMTACNVLDPAPKSATARPTATAAVASPKAASVANTPAVGASAGSLASRAQPAPRNIAPPVSSAPKRATQVDASETMPATTNVSRVTFAEEGSDFDPCISRDGTRLVFASTQHRATADIYIKRTDSRVVTQLTNDPAEDAMPKISPDGQRIAFASNRAGSWDIFVMPIGGGKAVQITGDISDELHPSWSPDGTQLVFSRLGEASGRWEMWVASLHNPAVAHFIGYGLFPEWCPIAATGTDGGDRILFQLGRERGRRAFGLWTIEVSNGTATNATEIAGAINTALINPSWSPDGDWIVYAEVPVEPEDMQVFGSSIGERPLAASLWMLSVEGEGKVRLTSGAGVSLGPTWGANNRMYFVTDRSGSDNVWSMDLAPALAAAMAATNTHHASAPGGSAAGPKQDHGVATAPDEDSDPENP